MKNTSNHRFANIADLKSEINLFTTTFFGTKEPKDLKRSIVNNNIDEKLKSKALRIVKNIKHIINRDQDLLTTCENEINGLVELFEQDIPNYIKFDQHTGEYRKNYREILDAIRDLTVPAKERLIDAKQQDFSFYSHLLLNVGQNINYHPISTPALLTSPSNFRSPAPNSASLPSANHRPANSAITPSTRSSHQTPISGINTAISRSSSGSLFDYPPRNLNPDLNGLSPNIPRSSSSPTIQVSSGTPHAIRRHVRAQSTKNANSNSASASSNIVAPLTEAAHHIPASAVTTPANKSPVLAYPALQVSLVTPPSTRSAATSLTSASSNVAAIHQTAVSAVTTPANESPVLASPALQVSLVTPSSTRSAATSTSSNIATSLTGPTHQTPANESRLSDSPANSPAPNLSVSLFTPPSVGGDAPISTNKNPITQSTDSRGCHPFNFGVVTPSSISSVSRQLSTPYGNPPPYNNVTEQEYEMEQLRIKYARLEEEFRQYRESAQRQLTPSPVINNYNFGNVNLNLINQLNGIGFNISVPQDNAQRTAQLEVEITSQNELIATLKLKAKELSSERDQLRDTAQAQQNVINQFTELAEKMSQFGEVTYKIVEDVKSSIFKPSPIPHEAALDDSTTSQNISPPVSAAPSAPTAAMEFLQKRLAERAATTTSETSSKMADPKAFLMARLNKNKTEKGQSSNQL
jgi:cell division protein FtsB